jgi:3-phosphoshikimate 1-carboxyvinyltransferase
VNNQITIKPLKYNTKSEYIVESDWSSASYFYSLVALSENLSLTLKNFNEKNIQGDSKVAEIYKLFGVATQFNTLGESITISKTNKEDLSSIQFNLQGNPDLAQTIAVTSFGLGLPCYLKGLSTLKIKETDRLIALKTELTKLGAKVSITEESLEIEPSETPNKNILINTYQDHRMAMAFAPLAMLVPIQINNAEVVSKSFPLFWETIDKLGVNVRYVKKNSKI